MVPFEYPKRRHKRRFAPADRASHRGLKPLLRDEFGGQCVYCRLPDTVIGEAVFGVDHYRPQKHFPELAGVYSNLFYCCNGCNSRKGDEWPSDEERRRGRVLPNPCDHVMSKHLRFNGTEVETRSEAGVYAEELLMLNDPDSVSYRAFLAENIEHWKKIVRTAEAALHGLSSAIRKEPDSARKVLLERDRDETRSDLRKAKEQLEIFSGFRRAASFKSDER